LDDETLAELGDAARLVSVALLLLADDYGNGRARPAFIASSVWAYHDTTEKAKVAASCLSALAKARYVILYQVDGQQYFHIRNWDKHQRISHPSPPAVPGPPNDSGAIPEKILNPPEPLRPEGKGREGKGEEVNNSQPNNSPSDCETVFAAYVEARDRVAKGGSKPTLTASRRELIKRRLREFPAEDLAAACRGIWLDRWHVEQHQTSLELCLRDAGHIEKFRELGLRVDVLAAFAAPKSSGIPPCPPRYRKEDHDAWQAKYGSLDKI
jgi:hypothetical protein